MGQRNRQRDKSHFIHMMVLLIFLVLLEILMVSLTGIDILLGKISIEKRTFDTALVTVSRGAHDKSLIITHNYQTWVASCVGVPTLCRNSNQDIMADSIDFQVINQNFGLIEKITLSATQNRTAKVMVNQFGSGQAVLERYIAKQRIFPLMILAGMIGVALALLYYGRQLKCAQDG